MIATITNFGDNLGVQLPKSLLKDMHISENDDVEILNGYCLSNNKYQQESSISCSAKSKNVGKRSDSLRPAKNVRYSCPQL